MMHHARINHHLTLCCLMQGWLILETRVILLKILRVVVEHVHHVLVLLLLGNLALQAGLLDSVLHTDLGHFNILYNWARLLFAIFLFSGPSIFFPRFFSLTDIGLFQCKAFSHYPTFHWNSELYLRSFHSLFS